MGLLSGVMVTFLVGVSGNNTKGEKTRGAAEGKRKAAGDGKSRTLSGFELPLRDQRSEEDELMIPAPSPFLTESARDDQPQ